MTARHPSLRDALIHSLYRLRRAARFGAGRFPNPVARFTFDTLESRRLLSVTTIMDNGDAGFTEAGSWGHSTVGYQQDADYSAAGTGSDLAVWTFHVPAGTYRVSATWSVGRGAATNAPFTVYDGTRSLGTVLRSQAIAPNDFSGDGVNWERLGDFTTNSDTLQVRLTDKANGIVTADAIYLERITPALGVSVEPMESGSVVYEPVAPSKSGAAGNDLLALLLSIQSKESSGSTHVNKVQISFPGHSNWGPFGYSANLSLNPGQSGQWFSRNDKNYDSRVRLANIEPSQVRLEVFADGFTKPATLTLPLKPHVSPVAGGAYLFPARTSDLRIGEYWSGSSNHATGALGSQLFGYDLGVIGFDNATQKWSYNLPGTDGTHNADSRIWGKPIYAMADGVVLEAVNAVPNNPHPLQWSSDADLANKMQEQKDKYWGSFTNGGAGNHFYIRHGDEVILYAHMQKGSLNSALLRPGSIVKAGTFLGYAGNSGNSTGPHLHIHAIQGTKPEEGPLRPLPFRNTWVLDWKQLSSPTPNAPWVKAQNEALPDVSSAIWPSATAPTWYPPGYAELSKHNVPAGSLQTEFDKIAQSGYRPVWLDGFNGASGRAFNMIFRPADGKAWVARADLTASAYQSEFNLRTGQGYRLSFVDSYTNGSTVLYAAIFTKEPGGQWVAYHGLSASAHQAKFNTLTAQGYVPVNISGVSINGVKTFTGLYEKKSVGGFVALDSMTPSQYQTQYDANKAAGRELVYLNAYTHNGSPRIIAIWYQNSGFTSIVARHGLTAAQYQTEFDKQLAAGYLTQAVTGYLENGVTKFAAFWGK
jgi:murein DD-endopeptidase MepM/ murein hydrolase activator NlpD